MNSTSILRQFFAFLRRPKLESKVSIARGIKMWRVLQMWGIFAIVSFLLSLLITQVLESIDFSETEHAISRSFSESPAIAIFFLSAVQAPLLEETIFRFLLDRKAWKGFLSLFLFCVFLLPLLFPLEGVDVGVELLIFLAVSIVGVGILATLYRMVDPSGERYVRVIKKLFPGLFYVTSIGFGVLHAFNYADWSQIWIFLPLLLLPQTLLGFLFGFFRVHYGFWYAVISHALHNVSLVLPVVFIALTSSETRELLNTNADFEVADLPPTDLFLVILSGGSFLFVGLCAVIVGGYAIWKSLSADSMHNEVTA